VAEVLPKYRPFSEGVEKRKIKMTNMSLGFQELKNVPADDIYYLGVREGVSEEIALSNASKAGVLVETVAAKCFGLKSFDYYRD